MFIWQKLGLTSITSSSTKQDLGANQQGVYLVFSAVAILVLFAIVALGIEVGRWYAIQAEISKSVDGAAFAGAANAGNFTQAELETMVKDVAAANFPEGIIGTENLNITVANDGSGKITVNGDVDAVNPIASVLGTGHDKTKVGSLGVAKLRKFEIVLVLDESGSMGFFGGAPIQNLRTAAKAFVQSFQSLEADPANKMGLVSFASGVQKRYPLTDQFVDDLVAEIDTLYADGHTNAEEALDRATDDGTEGMGISMGWSDQSGFPPNERTGQYIIFFSDGQPTAFRGALSTNGSQPVDAGIRWGSSSPTSIRKLDAQNQRLWIGGDRGSPIPTGPGTGSARWDCNPNNNLANTWKWWILDPLYDQDGQGNNVYSVTQPMIYDKPNPVLGLDPIGCIPNQTLRNYGDLVAQQMAVDHAQEIKNVKEYQIYTIGLGGVDANFLSKIASGPEFEFFANDSTDLTAVFQEIANRIKLVLIK